ncbi:MAG: transcriptional regulator [Clostridiales bacterium 38-18]|nr:MAG: transcriptional regulator [Clostridiales bacterium 38-18]
MLNHTEVAKVFKAFCDSNRLQIIESLQHGEKCACNLLEELQIVQSTLSHHMKILIESQVVIQRRNGKWTYYQLSDQGFEKALKLLSDLQLKAADYAPSCQCE